LELRTRQLIWLCLPERILRYYAALNIVTEPSMGHYEANNITRNLAEKVTQAGIGH